MAYLDDNSKLQPIIWEVNAGTKQLVTDIHSQEQREMKVPMVLLAYLVNFHSCIVKDPA